MEEVIKRGDGREANEIRATTIKIGVISGAKGSCLIQKENSKVISSVQIKTQDESIDFEFTVKVTFAQFGNNDLLNKRKEVELQEILTQSLVSRINQESNKGKIICLQVFVMEQDGSVEDSIINSSSLALFDSEIQMDSIIIATTVVKLPIYNQVIVDPTALEEEKKEGSVLIACIPSNSSITQIYMSGVLDPQDISSCLSIALDSCWKLNKEIELIIQSKNVKMIEH
ncbi:3' exoribonuclease family protein [Entamoeba histolytica HM-1:IMSS-B]|uniref:3' exoribonuclease family protein n=8 Tax=Entamoeba histolytica TaxID=5759 RepID=C4LW17_ENTH1|nr:3' exoribonuclease family protein [Entamoeba histolytica HM-1:IMSS]XP_654766.1 3' exoribonuclease family protein [Entamoeba histolytica HM-1:IMSS]EMD48315.1 3' exoribonuclease family protein [Entamoeba histolytica KU27]EMH74472.1 3' exoribonuclease family protein [Entamoeba histolytica HM-1:IMSS-B]EMS12717.1 3' exoribonuclease family protein [Entamoeba histolytica HM-3:IMSS]ENY64259.1 3' exoribonuclease family protein, putative [Entamoeba histolytica HM-1:IMSS-A]GAT92879.1 3 exoribonucleas|eukprot:XP_652459.1 3' exoribonuclease family protein [Entamoeba histolytica HM-1:IMSS]